MFTIPSEAAAGAGIQSEFDPVDLDILVAAGQQVGWLAGCAVTAQGSPNMTVAVAAGTVVVAGVLASVSAGNVTITTANASNPRFDLICVDNAGAKSAVAGTPAVAPVFPAIPANSMVLAAVYVPANDTTISTDQIIDKRMGVVRTPKVVSGALTTGNVSFSSTTYADLVASGGMDLIVPGIAGDRCLAFLGIGGVVSAVTSMFFDFQTVAGSNWVAGTGGTTAVGMGELVNPVSGIRAYISALAPYTLVSGDLSGGAATFRPRGRVATANTYTLYGTTTSAGANMRAYVVNFGQ